MQSALLQTPRISYAAVRAGNRLPVATWVRHQGTTTKYTEDKSAAPQNTPVPGQEKVSYSENYDENQLRSMAQDKEKLAKSTTEKEAKEAAKPQLEGKESLKGV